MHWRGDRTGGNDRANAQPDSGAFDEDGRSRQFQRRRSSACSAATSAAPRRPTCRRSPTSSWSSRYPPNPIRNLDNSLDAASSSGTRLLLREHRATPRLLVRGLPPARPEWQRRIRRRASGLLRDRRPVGQRGLPANLQDPAPAQRLHEGGRFGFFNLNPFVETVTIRRSRASWATKIRGFGNNRGGDIDRVFRFMHATTFSQNFVFGPNPEGFLLGPAGDDCVVRSRPSFSRSTRT